MIVTIVGTCQIIPSYGESSFVAVSDIVDPEDLEGIIGQLIEEFRIRRGVTAENVEIFTIHRGEPELLNDNTSHGWTSTR